MLFLPRSRSLLISFVLLSAACCVVPAHAQTAPGPPNPSVPSAAPSFGDSSPDAAMAAKMMKERNADRQKTIVDETNQLLDLAKQLKDAVDKSDKDQLSMQVVKKAEEIEKLAKDVKSKMRDGIVQPLAPPS